MVMPTRKSLADHLFLSDGLQVSAANDLINGTKRMINPFKGRIRTIKEYNMAEMINHLLFL